MNWILAFYLLVFALACFSAWARRQTKKAQVTDLWRSVRAADSDRWVGSAVSLDAPHLQAVIEAPASVPEFVGEVPPRPWPSHVRLHGSTPQSHIALIVGQLVQYGGQGRDGSRGLARLWPRRGQPQDLAALCRDFPQAAPGGLLAVGQGAEIFPSCCCGLESWRQWERLLVDGQQPWLGHDPWPWVDVSDRAFTVWSRGGSDDDAEGAFCVKFTPEELRVALQAVERDLVAFSELLRGWSERCERNCGDALAAAFTRVFITRPGGAA